MRFPHRDPPRKQMMELPSFLLYFYQIRLIWDLPPKPAMDSSAARSTDSGVPGNTQ